MVDGTPFDWSAIDPFDLDNESVKKVSKLLKQIAEDMNANKALYNLIQFESIAEGLKQYGYNNCSYFGFSTTGGFPDYFKNGPVLAHAPLSTGGEITWVVDGIQYTKDVLKQVIGQDDTIIIDMYCRMNWGYSGEGNGYYLTYYFHSKEGKDDTYNWAFEACETSMVVVPAQTKFLSVK